MGDGDNEGECILWLDFRMNDGDDEGERIFCRYFGKGDGDDEGERIFCRGFRMGDGERILWVDFLVALTGDPALVKFSYFPCMK